MLLPQLGHQRTRNCPTIKVPKRKGKGKRAGRRTGERTPGSPAPSHRRPARVEEVAAMYTGPVISGNQVCQALTSVAAQTFRSLAAALARLAGSRGLFIFFSYFFDCVFGLVFFGSVSGGFPMLFAKIINGIAKNPDPMKVSEEPKHFGKGGARRNAGASQPCGHPYP